MDLQIKIQKNLHRVIILSIYRLLNLFIKLTLVWLPVSAIWNDSIIIKKLSFMYPGFCGHKIKFLIVINDNKSDMILKIFIEMTNK